MYVFFIKWLEKKCIFFKFDFYFFDFVYKKSIINFKKGWIDYVFSVLVIYYNYVINF